MGFRCNRTPWPTDRRTAMCFWRSRMGVGRIDGVRIIAEHVDSRQRSTASRVLPRMADQPSRILSFSTDMLPVRDRFDMFREEIAHQVCRIDVRGADRSSFYAHFKFAKLAALNCGRIDVSPASYGRTNDLIADGNDDFVLLINRSAQVHHGRTDAMIGKGGAFLEDNARTDYITFPQSGALLTVNLPRTVLRRLVPSVEDLLGRQIDSAAPALRLLKSYVLAVLQSDATDPALLDLAGQHVLELAAIALEAKDGVAPNDGRSSVRTARLVEIRRSIHENLGNPALSLPIVAALTVVSERYVQL